MKKVLKYIAASAATLFAAFIFAPAASAQNVQYDKTVSGPDANGVYTISLEAYVTGSLTVDKTPNPADIILVLDRSGSMDWDVEGKEVGYYKDNIKRINILKSAVQTFVESVKESNKKIKAEDRDSHGGHRIAIVWFSGDNLNDQNAVYTRIQGLNTLQNVESLETVPESYDEYYGYDGYVFNYTAAKVSYNNRDLLNVDADGGTMAHRGMQRAESILDGVTYPSDSKRSRVVIFFTDGEPGGWKYSGDDFTVNTNNKTVADGVIHAANNIKTSTKYPATVFSVGMFDKTAGTVDAVTTYLSYTSSDFTNKIEMPGRDEYVAVSGDKSIVVSSAGALANVFASISESTTGGNYDAASASSVMVDIVTNSFSIPTNADLGSVKVYKDTCTKASPTAITTFAPEKATGWVEITNQVTLKTHQNDPTNTPEGEVSVTGFDYGKNWCGWDQSANNGQGGPHGNKLVMKIPITVNEDAVGGPNVETNADGAKLIIKDKDGNEIKSYDFVSPTLKIPVSIWIQKQGLVGDDSAVFTLRRSPFKGFNPSDPESNKWETFTKTVVNEKNMVEVTDDKGNKVKVVKISGLDPDYFYKIEEDAWGFGYTYQDGGIHYTVGDNLKNPFVFVNTPKDVKKAEAVVRNVFEERTTEIQTNSK